MTATTCPTRRVWPPCKSLTLNPKTEVNTLVRLSTTSETLTPPVNCKWKVGGLVYSVCVCVGGGGANACVCAHACVCACMHACVHTCVCVIEREREREGGGWREIEDGERERVYSVLNMWNLKCIPGPNA